MMEEYVYLVTGGVEMLFFYNHENAQKAAIEIAKDKGFDENKLYFDSDDQADHLFSHEIDYKEEEGIEDICTIYLVEINDAE